jgi:hypothetical protein
MAATRVGSYAAAFPGGWMKRIRRVLAALLFTLGVAVLTASRAEAQPFTPNQKFVNLIYLDLLGRSPSAGELAIAGQLDSASLTRLQVAAALTSSPEFLTRQVSGYYQLLLHRSPAPAEASPFLSLLTSGQSFEHVQAIIAGSVEYFTNRAGGTNDGFLDAIFADELNRAVDPASRSGFGSLLTGGTSRTQVTDFILDSNEYRSDLVNTYYPEFLRRSPLAGEVSGGVTFLSGQTDQNYIDALVSSAEYFNLAQTVPEPSCAGCVIVGTLGTLGRRLRYRLP